MASRRTFLHNLATGSTAAGITQLLPLGLEPVAKADTRVSGVGLDKDIEPVVRLLEKTPRDQLLEEVAARVKQGTVSYRQVVAALMLAGVRNVQPRPHVGFKFHTVLVVNSAHLASINSAANDRWLPIFWALDYFKSAQAQDKDQGDWSMSRVNEKTLPSPQNARVDFIDAMDRWDPEKADAASAVLARTVGENELFELLAHYGSRDFRDIGHKAIYVANAFRTLGCIGWQHAEPILRSLTYALQCRGNDPNPADHDLTPDQPERLNLELIKTIREDWQAGREDPAVTGELIDVLHECDERQAAQAVVEKLNEGISARSLYDALFLSAGEMLMRKSNIISLHAVTMTNAMGYCFRRASDPSLRLRLLTQNASFLAMFLQRLNKDTGLRARKVGELQPEVVSERQSEALQSVMGNIGKDNDLAAAQALHLLDQDPSAATALIREARRTVFLKGTNTHDYKFSSAVLEDYHHISPAWRNRYLATSVYKLRGTGERDTKLLPRIRSALA